MDAAMPIDPELMLPDLPLFPLRSVLFPGGWLPLQIFEVRYLDMIARCHATGAPFGVVCLTEGDEVRRRVAAGAEAFVPEVFHPVGTLATIAEFERPQPGLIIVRCLGTQRFRLDGSRRLSHGLWVGQATRLPDDQPLGVPADLAHVSATLKELVEQLAADADDPAELPLRQPYRWNDCGWLANRWCELLPMPVEAKQRMMELDSPLVRLELVSDVLERMGAGSKSTGKS